MTSTSARPRGNGWMCGRSAGPKNLSENGRPNRLMAPITDRSTCSWSPRLSVRLVRNSGIPDANPRNSRAPSFAARTAVRCFSHSHTSGSQGPCDYASGIEAAYHGKVVPRSASVQHRSMTADDFQKIGPQTSKPTCCWELPGSGDWSGRVSAPGLDPESVAVCPAGVHDTELVRRCTRWHQVWSDWASPGRAEITRARLTAATRSESGSRRNG